MIDVNRDAYCIFRYNLSQFFFLNLLYAKVASLSAQGNISMEKP